jgi:hypothetical protein
VLESLGIRRVIIMRLESLVSGARRGSTLGKVKSLATYLGFLRGVGSLIRKVNAVS